MKTFTRFEKVSFRQFKNDWIDNITTDKDLYNIYENIKLPKRSSRCSAGYDFFLPCGMTFYTNDIPMIIPTGIRCVDMKDDEVLMIFSRSGLGIKKRLVVAQGTGIIDSDYELSGNEGHIFVALVNQGTENIKLEQGKAFCQGIITKYATTVDDNADGVRNGGLGSSDNTEKE